MAQALIESMSEAWEPEKYRDEYRTALMEIIEQKAKNKQIAAKAAARAHADQRCRSCQVLQESLSALNPSGRNGAAPGPADIRQPRW
jgi:DNA end-binding protein Ku